MELTRPQKTKVLLIDDHQLFNDGLKSLLSTETHLDIVGQVFEAKNVLFSIQRLSPGLVFLDINLPDQNGLEVAKSILQNFPELKIIFLTMYADAAMLREAKKIGVHGYILKNSSKRILLEGIQKVMEGGVFFDEKLDEKPTESIQKDDLSRTFTLTQREREIVRYVVEGLDSYQIAEQMSLSYLTIKTHRRNIHFKLGTSSTSELIRFARENGI
jgi:DNA-binding NarL/FixJ family response regulator